MVNIEVRDAYNRYLCKSEPLTKIMIINGGDKPPFELTVGLGYVDVVSEDLILRGSVRVIHTANIAVGLTHSGDMKILKNRGGNDGVYGSSNSRSTILESLLLYGFSEINAYYILGEFNGVVKSLITPPMVKFKIPKHKMV